MNKALILAVPLFLTSAFALAASPTLSVNSPLIVGQQSTLSWTSDGATSCVGTGFDTRGATAGSTTITPTTVGTVSVSCGSVMPSAALAISAAAAPPLPAGCTSKVPTPIDGNVAYKLTLDEEFNGTSIDKNKWQVTYDGNADHTYGDYNNAYFYPSTNLKVSNGVADFMVSKVGTDYRTAAVTSKTLQAYGYWEAKVKFPANANHVADGIGVNFWQDASGWVFPEIDVLEWFGQDSSTGHSSWLYAQPVDGNNSIGFSHAWTDPDPNAWKILGMLWEPTRITWYLNGKSVASETRYVDQNNANPMWTLIGATVGGWGFNKVTSSTVFPAHYAVDWIHRYSNSGSAAAVTPDAGYCGPGGSQ